jgi:hypothetical protein
MQASNNDYSRKAQEKSSDYGLVLTDDINRRSIPGVALQAQYVFDTFGKSPGTVLSILVMPHLQARHLGPGV